MQDKTGNKNPFYGKKHTKETVEKMKLAKLKNPTRYWFGKKRPEVKTFKGFGIKKGSISHNKGKKLNPEWVENLRKSHVGKKLSLESIRKRSLLQSGKNHYKWKGGITPENRKIRNSFEMRLWRKACLERDNFTCQKYGIVGGVLRVHHINNFADFPELRTSIENGIVLSEKAHKEFHKKYGNKNNTREQVEEFINRKLSNYPIKNHQIMLPSKIKTNPTMANFGQRFFGRACLGVCLLSIS